MSIYRIRLTQKQIGRLHELRKATGRTELQTFDAIFDNGCKGQWGRIRLEAQKVITQHLTTVTDNNGNVIKTVQGKRVEELSEAEAQAKVDELMSIAGTKKERES